MVSPIPDTYHVAMKAFVRKGRSVLLCKPRFGSIPWEWDLPGGRIGTGEFNISLEKILYREITEELGPNIRYRNRGIAALFRYRRPKVTAKRRPGLRVFMVGFALEYLRGDIVLSAEHSEYRWVPLANAARYLSGGQRDGMRKYLVYLKKRKLMY